MHVNMTMAQYKQMKRDAKKRESDLRESLIGRDNDLTNARREIRELREVIDSLKRDKESQAQRNAELTGRCVELNAQVERGRMKMGEIAAQATERLVKERDELKALVDKIQKCETIVEVRKCL